MHELYIVVRDGVYRHEITGVFDTLSKAINEAKETMEKEDDRYHDCVVLKYVINKPVEDGAEIGRWMSRRNIEMRSEPINKESNK